MPRESENEEAQEQAEAISRKRETLERFVANGGVVGQRRPAGDAPSAGWIGEQPFESTAPDDWEPAIATDPAHPWVYALVTRYGVSKPCSGNCPTPYIALRVSPDGGATWGAAKALCPCKGSGQFDPIIEVVPSTGDVYAAYMNGFNVLFTKSNDHGGTWSPPVPVYGKVSWNDKPILAVSDDGMHVYISFNGPTGGDPYVAQSHDFGKTWKQTKIVDSARYVFAFDGDVAPDGTVYFSESSLHYGGGGNKGTYPTDAIEEHVYVSKDGARPWLDRLVATVQPGVKCLDGGCTPDYYLGHSALAVDGNGGVDAPVRRRRHGRRSADHPGLPVEQPWRQLVGAGDPLDGRRAGDRSRGRVSRDGRRARLVDGDVGRRQPRCLERLVPPLDGRWRHVGQQGQAVGCDRWRGLQDRGRLRRAIRRLRRDGHHQRRQGDRHLGRGPQLRRSGRRLVQPGAVAPAGRRRTRGPSASGSPAADTIPW